MYSAQRLTKILCSVAAFLFVQGCTTKVDGDVFIVTKGGESAKLGLVEVYAVPEKNLSDAKKTILSEYESATDKFLSAHQFPSLKAVSERLFQAKEELAVLGKKYCNISTEVSKVFTCDKVPKSQMADAQMRIDGATSELKEMFSEAVKLQKSELNLELKDYLVHKIKSYAKGTDVVMAKSNADGKFSMTLPRGGYIVIALGRRQALKEDYTWAVRLDSGVTSLSLANDSMIDRGCPNCFFSKDDMLKFESIYKKLSLFHVKDGSSILRCNETKNNAGVMAMLVYLVSQNEFDDRFERVSKCLYS